MPRRPGVLLLSAVAIVLLAGAARKRAVNPAPSFPLDARRSLIITDQAILDGFSFERVMQALVARSGTRTTALRLYQQLFDTQNPKPGRIAADAPHCDDFLVDGKPAFNGLPRRCPTSEGALAATDPFRAGDHIPIAVVNRFDMTPVDGAHCGQYRVVFARRSNTNFQRLHLIFEAVLPNPDPRRGIEACRPVAQFWADLSGDVPLSERRARIERFFFTGLEGFAPVIHPDHYTAASGGGIRTMHNTDDLLKNRFYQFRLARRGQDLIAEPDVLENMPMGKFFDATNDTPLAKRFRDAFIDNVRNLAVKDENLFFLDLPREFLLAESNPGQSELDVVFEVPFVRGSFSPEGRAFSARIQSELRKAGSDLEPIDVVRRANHLSCTGCHFFRGNVNEDDGFGYAPLGVEFYQHISESFTEEGEAGPRFAISRTLRETFLPHRLQILRAYLQSGKAPVRSNATLGGNRTVH